MNAADSEAETGAEFSVRGPEQSAYRQADARSAAENSAAGGAMGADSALEVPVSPPPLRRQTAFRPIPILAAWIAAAAAIGFALFLLITDMGHGGVPRLTAYAFVAIIVLPPWVMPRRWNGVWLAAVFAGAVFQAGVSFGGSFAWLRIGLAYGEHHFLDMAIGPTHNFANVLRNRFGWSLDQDPDNLFTMPVPWSDTPVTFYVKPLLCTVYGVCLALSAIGAALHARNRDPRVLMALVAPWVCAFAILCQMHERYAMYGCALASLGIAAGAGEALLYFVLAFAATQPMLDAALSRHAGANPQLLQFLQQTDPSLGWLFLILAAVYLWIAIAPRRRSEPFAGS